MNKHRSWPSWPSRILGVEDGSSTDEIHRAARSRRAVTHPDRHPQHPKAARHLFELVNEAERELSGSAIALVNRPLALPMAPAEKRLRDRQRRSAEAKKRRAQAAQAALDAAKEQRTAAAKRHAAAAQAAHDAANKQRERNEKLRHRAKKAAKRKKPRPPRLPKQRGVTSGETLALAGAAAFLIFAISK